MTRILPLLLLFAGAVSVVVGVALISRSAGFITAGVLLIAGGVAALPVKPVKGSRP